MHLPCAALPSSQLQKDRIGKYASAEARFVAAQFSSAQLYSALLYSTSTHSGYHSVRCRSHAIATRIQLFKQTHACARWCIQLLRDRSTTDDILSIFPLLLLLGLVLLVLETSAIHLQEVLVAHRVQREPLPAPDGLADGEDADVRVEQRAHDVEAHRVGRASEVGAVRAVVSAFFIGDGGVRAAHHFRCGFSMAVITPVVEGSVSMCPASRRTAIASSVRWRLRYLLISTVRRSGQFPVRAEGGRGVVR